MENSAFGASIYIEQVELKYFSLEIPGEIIRKVSMEEMVLTPCETNADGHQKRHRTGYAPSLAVYSAGKKWQADGEMPH